MPAVVSTAQAAVAELRTTDCRLCPQVLMLMLITLLNDGALISIGYDNVAFSPVPPGDGAPALLHRPLGPNRLPEPHARTAWGIRRRVPQ